MCMYKCICIYDYTIPYFTQGVYGITTLVTGSQGYMHGHKEYMNAYLLAFFVLLKLQKDFRRVKPPNPTLFH